MDRRNLFVSSLGGRRFFFKKRKQNRAPSAAHAREGSRSCLASSLPPRPPPSLPPLPSRLPPSLIGGTPPHAADAELERSCTSASVIRGVRKGSEGEGRVRRLGEVSSIDFRDQTRLLLLFSSLPWLLLALNFLRSFVSSAPRK